MLGIDSDNDSTFMSQAVFDYCKGRGLEQTRSRPYKKNDQAWVEQKNGAVVRRLVGYGRLSGSDATKALAQLYESSRLYINFFQPSFKLKSKTRDGARVHKVYFAPATPCERLVAHSGVEPAIKEKVTAQFKRLDPVRRLQEIRIAQQTLSDIAAHGVPTEVKSRSAADVAAFLQSLTSAWTEGEVRPTASQAAQGQTLVEDSHGPVRRRVASHRRLADRGALDSGQGLDGPIGRDGSRALCR
jgi:hypothetical protein